MATSSNRNVCLHVALLLLFLGFSPLTSAAITYVGSGTFAESANANVVPTLPSGHAANDVNLVLVGFETAAGTVSISGYTLLFLQSDANSKLYLFCKVDGGAESNPTVMVSGGSASNPVLARAYTIRSASTDCSNIVAHAAGQNNSAFDLTVEYPALAVSTANTFVAIAYLHGENNSGDNTPAGFTDTGYMATGLGTDASMNLKYQIQTTAANISSGAITQSGSQPYISKSIVISLKPTSVTPATATVCDSGCTYTYTQLASTAISARVPGDILELRATTPGATEEKAARMLCFGVSGTAGNPITVRVRAGDHIRLDTSTGNDVGLLDFTDCDHWNLAFSESDPTAMEFADPSVWNETCAKYNGSPFNCYPNRRTIMMRNVSDIALSGFTAHGAGTMGSSVDATIFDRHSSFIYIRNAKFDLQGTNDNGNNSDSGELAIFHADHVLVEDATFSHGGHTNLWTTGSYQIFRRTINDGNWADIRPGPYTGNHAASYLQNWPAGDSHQTYGSPYFGPLIENGIFVGVGTEPEHATWNQSVLLLGINSIFRQNYIVQRSVGYALNVCGTAISEPIGGATLRDAYQQIYHNTSWGGAVHWNTGQFGQGTQPDDQCAMGLNANNLWQGVEPGTKSGQLWAWRHGTPSNGPYPNPLKGWQHLANIFGAHPTNPTQNMEFNISGVGPGWGVVAVTNGADNNGDGDCVDAGETGTWPTLICGNKNVQLTWANGTTTAFTNPVPAYSAVKSTLILHPTSSAGLGDARHLTTTTDSGTNDTTLILGSARPFKDDWGFANHTWGGLHREYGDCICVGPTSSSTAAQCVATRIADNGINYSTGAITVATGVTHAAGSKVWKAVDNGDGTCGAVWDNRGAAQ